MSAEWADVMDVGIRLPTSTPAQWRVVDLANWWWPAMGAPRTIEVGVGLRGTNVELDLGRPMRCSWRLQVVLDDLLEVLRKGRDFSPLARPDVMREVERLTHRVPAVARVFVYTDFFGLERFVGARGAYRSDLSQAIAAAG